MLFGVIQMVMNHPDSTIPPAHHWMPVVYQNIFNNTKKRNKFSQVGGGGGGGA